MSSTEATVSVVLPVHAGVDPSHLRTALDSLMAQTRLPDEIVLVEDGPLSEAHRGHLSWVGTVHPCVVRVVLDRNCGAGVANQRGLEAATGEWIMKADADDVSTPRRLASQLDEVMRTGADVCGTAMSEFRGSEDNVTAVRRPPPGHRAIVKRMRTNNPINHPTALYRRSLALTAGGYPDMRYMQDYVLFARMACAGAVMCNLPEPLVLFRGGEEMQRRRRGLAILRLEWRLQRELQGCGLLGPARAIANIPIRVGYRLLPPPIMRWAHEHLLASRVSGEVPA